MTQHGTLQFGGRTRTYEVDLPPAWDNKTKFPILIGCHGGGGTAGSFKTQTGLDKFCAANGIVLVCPEGTGPGRYGLPSSPDRALTFNAGICCGYAVEQNVDDVGFIGALLDVLAKYPGADMSRVYVCGMSNGGMMACRVAIELRTRIAAVCAVAATAGVEIPIGTLPLKVPYLAIHGLLDNNAPIEGGIGSAVLPGFPKVEHRPVWGVCETWAFANGVKDVDPTLTRVGEHLRFEWKQLAPVILYLLANHGHQWPNGQDMTPNYSGDGSVCRTFDANETMWAFFQRFTRQESH